jgi:hypothetical protein
MLVGRDHANTINSFLSNVMYKNKLFHDLDEETLIKLDTNEASLLPYMYMNMFSLNMLLTSLTIHQYFFCQSSDIPLTWSKPLNPTSEAKLAET